MKSNNSN